jgi:hypothetical protein
MHFIAHVCAVPKPRCRALAQIADLQGALDRPTAVSKPHDCGTQLPSTAHFWPAEISGQNL